MGWREYHDAQIASGSYPDDDPPRRHLPARCDACGRFIASGKARVYQIPDNWEGYGPADVEVYCSTCDPFSEADARRAQQPR
jgi:hypothetical protein